MIKSLTTIVCLALIFPTLVAAQEESTTTWKGTLNLMGTKMRIEIDLKKEGEEVSGVLRNLDRKNEPLKMESVIFNKNGLEFYVPKQEVRYAGSFQPDGTILGQVDRRGQKFGLKFSKGKFGEGEEEAVMEKLREAWLGTLKAGPINAKMQFRIVTTEDGKTKAYFDSLSEGVKGIDVTKWSDENGELTFEVGALLAYSGKLDAEGKTAEGIFKQGGIEIPMTLEKTLEEAENKNTWENRPQKPVAPFPYVDEVVTFENKNHDVTLAGTLTIPTGDEKHPAVILISGSGPQDRDETLMGHKPFLVLADYLSRNGIAVLRYDDRGTAKSTGDHETATTEDFAHDAAAAVDFLKSHSKIDATKIGLCGHSEGGVIAPMVAGLRDNVAFIVLMAGTGVDGKTIGVSQAQAMALANGASAEDAKMAGVVSGHCIDLVIQDKLDDKEAIEVIVTKVLDAMPEEERKEQASMVRSNMKANVERIKTRWMRFFLAYDPAPALEKVTCPVLSIIGSKDSQVLPNLNQPAIRAALEKGGNPNFEMVELPSLNHLFQKCTTGALGEYAEIQETFNPEALKRIGDWILKQTNQATPSSVENQ